MSAAPTPDSRAPDSRVKDQSPSTTATRRNRKRRWLRFILWSAGALLVILLVAASAGVLWLRSASKATLPTLDGELHVSGLTAPVTVRRDAHGVPHIDAATQDDLFFSQGYVTAQDRLWQMDASRRNAIGELAEILGPSLLNHDKSQRVLQIRVTAERLYAHLSSADRARLDDYARGVNAFIAQHQDALPVEFRLLAYQPRPWTSVDSLCVGLMMVETLDTHFPTKLSRELVAAKLNDPKLEADLYPVSSWRDHPPTGIRVDLSQPHPELRPPADDADDADTQSSNHPSHVPAPNTPPSAQDITDQDTSDLLAALALTTCGPCTPGSNNWVVAGSHTASGKPLLSNDMHLDLTEPNIWYMADLRAPGYHAAGVTLPGFPLIIAGHNEHVAWGFTALMGDVQDLYIEKLDGKGNYEGLDAQWHPLAVDREIVHVRGAKDVVLDVQSTGHGPLLNPILPNEKRDIALKWTLFDTNLNSLPLYEMNTAANWKEFSAALANWCWPTQNVVYSDDQGHIAYHAVGKIPIHPPGPSGVPFAHNVADSKSEWGDPDPKAKDPYIPFDDMPNAVDPPSGLLATANSRVTTDQSPYPITQEWVDPYRTERIYKLLEGRDGLTRKDMLAVQDDIYSEVDQELGQRFAYAIDHTDGVDDRLRKAADLMRSWDGRLTTDSAAASIVTQTRSALWPLLLKPKLGDDWNQYHWTESEFALEEIVMHARQEWLPPGYKNWDALLTGAVRKGMEQGKAPGDLSRWTYGSWHVVNIQHPLARLLPFAGRIAGTGAQPLAGDLLTVTESNITFGASQRFTMDWSDIDGSTENIVLGESSDPHSPYFRDQWNDWYAGTTFAFPFTPPAVAAQTHHTLRLLP